MYSKWRYFLDNEYLYRTTHNSKNVDPNFGGHVPPFAILPCLNLDGKHQYFFRKSTKCVSGSSGISRSGRSACLTLMKLNPQPSLLKTFILYVYKWKSHISFYSNIATITFNWLYINVTGDIVNLTNLEWILGVKKAFDNCFCNTKKLMSLSKWN